MTDMTLQEAIAEVKCRTSPMLTAPEDVVMHAVASGDMIPLAEVSGRADRKEEATNAPQEPNDQQ